MNYLKNKLKTRRTSGFFLHELHSLLLNFGISPARLLIKAGIEDRKNWRYPADEEVQQKVGRVLIYIEEHLTEELNLEELAKEIDLSKYQLIREFRKEEGTTPWKFLIQKRVEYSKELLKQGMPPGQAAVESGFYDQSHLSKVFREATGQTPKEYQENNFRNRN